MEKYKHAWFINFTGIGNGIIIAPILKCFEQSYPIIDYFHSENEILSDRWFVEKAGLKKLKGFSPIAWRRFSKKDWEEILDFINKNEIDLIINLRNEGPEYDTGYYEFKSFLIRDHKIGFWDLDFDVIKKRQVQENLTGDILNLLQLNGVDISTYEPQWLFAEGAVKKGIGFGMAASQKNKRWPTHKWVELAQEVIKAYNQKIILLHGLSQEEIDQALAVQKHLGFSKCELAGHHELKDITVILGKLKCFISNDTGLLHISSATGTHTIGLYTSTDPNIWSPYCKTNFLSCVNIFMEKCPARKIYCGNCFHYYDPCPAITQYSDSIDPKQVLDLIRKIMF
jgi:ADP-heptose:LPS heptosyltransferase